MQAFSSKEAGHAHDIRPKTHDNTGNPPQGGMTVCPVSEGSPGLAIGWMAETLIRLLPPPTFGSAFRWVSPYPRSGSRQHTTHMSPSRGRGSCGMDPGMAFRGRAARRLKYLVQKPAPIKVGDVETPRILLTVARVQNSIAKKAK